MDMPANIYICNAPISFPASEYGGMLVVVAVNRKELGRILKNVYGGRNGFNLAISVKGAKEMRLDPKASYGSGIIAEFLT